MAYVFRIHDIKGNNPQATAPIAAANVMDWSATDYIQGNLIDNIDISNSPRKMGTSIPSFFSRIFLFQGAFSTLGNNVNTHLAINPNTKLVSECFESVIGMRQIKYKHSLLMEMISIVGLQPFFRMRWCHTLN